MTKWAVINRQLDLGIPEPVETYSSSPHLYTDLEIPEGAKGRLPRSQRTREGLDAEVLEDLGETGKSSGRRPQGGGGGRSRGGRDGGRGDGGSRRSQDRAPREGGSGEGGSGEGGTREGAPRRRRNRRRTRGGQTGQASAQES